MKYFDDGCGAFGLSKGLHNLESLYRIAQEIVDYKWEPSYNIRPSSWNPVITKNSPRKIRIMRWGLVPSWWKQDPKKVQFSTINARCEDIETKPFFKGPIRNKRCIIPADFFFEWAISKDNPKEKVPFLFKMKDDSTFSFAGIYDIWKDIEGKEFPGFSILTTEANSLVGKYHTRMPVIIEEKNLDEWMDNSHYNPIIIKQLSQPYSAKKMEAYRVGKEIGNSKNDGKELIKKLPDIPVVHSKPAWQTLSSS